MTLSSAALRRVLLVAALFAFGACAPNDDTRQSAAGSLLYVWAGDYDRQDGDFLTVIDADRASPNYGSVVTTVPVEGFAHWPHHTEYELAAGGQLWANGFGSGTTFRFDVSEPRAPRVAGDFTSRGGYAYPHSYARLPNGHVIAAFQSTDEGYTPTGALVELDADGEYVRSASGISPDVPAKETWTYSLLVLPDVDRVVSTNTRMGLPDEWLSMMHAAEDSTHQHVSQDVPTSHIQIWRLSDLTLLHTVRLPPQAGGHNQWTAEARRLANGEVYVSTFSCGLYRLSGITSDLPKAEPAAWSEVVGNGSCGVPVIIDNYWIQPESSDRSIVAYDLSDPASPRMVSKLQLDPEFASPHWLALDPASPRLVVTMDYDPGVLIVNVDPATGALTLDEEFRDRGAAKPGVSFDRRTWPHGDGGRAQPHGAVFSLPR